MSILRKGHVTLSILGVKGHSIDLGSQALLLYLPPEYTNKPQTRPAPKTSSYRGTDLIVQSIYENYWHNLKQIATEFFSAGMHSGEVSLKHTKNPLRHLWGKQVKSAIKVTFSH